MSESGVTKSVPSVTPLWVVAAFVSLTEVVAGVALVRTQGAIQTAMASFVCLFPLLVAAAFFMILWHRPFVFYSPAEFGQHGVDVARYVEAMQRRPQVTAALAADIDSKIRATLTSPQSLSMMVEAVRRIDGVTDERQIGAMLDALASAAAKSVDESNFLTFDSRPLLDERGREWKELFADHETFGGLLDVVWLRCAPHIRPYTYGSAWILRDVKSGREIEGGQTWAVARGLRADTRSLEEAGVQPGMRLELTRSK